MDRPWNVQTTQLLSKRKSMFLSESLNGTVSWASPGSGGYLLPPMAARLGICETDGKRAAFGQFELDFAVVGEALGHAGEHLAGLRHLPPALRRAIVADRVDLD